MYYPVFAVLFHELSIFFPECVRLCPINSPWICVVFHHEPRCGPLDAAGPDILALDICIEYALFFMSLDVARETQLERMS